MNRTAKICQNQIVTQGRFFKLKRKIVVIADFLMNNKTDIDPKWIAGISHDVISASSSRVLR
jgi:hypothetical protein